MRTINQEISGALSEIHQISGSLSVGGGVSDYGDLTGKPSINGVTLSGDKSSADLNLAEKLFESGTGDRSIRQIQSDGNENTASGDISIALGSRTVASGLNSFTFGSKLSGNQFPVTTASGQGAVAIGSSVTASGFYAVAMGAGTKAAGNSSIAIGQLTEADGNGSVAVGFNTIASGRVCLVAGQYNIEDTSEIDVSHGAGARKYILIIGNGTAANAKSNAMTLDWDGNEVIAGKLTVGAGPTADMDVATKKYVDDTSPGLIFTDPNNDGNIVISFAG